MTRIAIILFIAGVATATAPFLRAQSAQPTKLEVASIKLLDPANMVIPSGDHDIEIHGDSLRDCCSLSEFIMDGYSVMQYQVLNLPRWDGGMGGDMYRIDAKASGPISRSQGRLMLQALLAERFHLALHTETRELPVYAMVVGKSGPKLPRLPATAKPGEGDPISLTGVSQMIGSRLDHPVVDRTGLEGQFDGTAIRWAEFGPMMRRGSIDPPGDAVFAAVQDQLGLKLELRKESTQVLVIDRVERPTQN